MLLTTLRDFGCFHSRGFTGHTRDKNGAPDPSGCVFYAVTNAPILCKQEAKNPPVSVTGFTRVVFAWTDGLCLTCFLSMQ